MAFATIVCQQTLLILPTEEKYAMTNQLRRSVQAIPANIAEGYSRYHYLDNIRFCYIARGSLEETFSHITLALNLSYLDQNTYQNLNSELQVLRRMINGYIAFLKRSKQGENESNASFQVKEDTIDYEFNDIIEK
jgi:four helix bundle protein